MPYALNPLCAATWRAHDLLWWQPLEALITTEPLPAWARTSVAQKMPVVLRRAPSPTGIIPVGLRGLTRSQRLAAYLPAAVATLVRTPEALAEIAQQRHYRACKEGAPALQLLARLAPHWFDLGWNWGPVGSVGFALATGSPVLRADSDLDVLVRVPHIFTSQQATALAALCALADSVRPTACRLDVQIETPFGAFAWREWQRNKASPVLLKTNTKPVLVMDPWLPPTANPHGLAWAESI